MSTRQKAVSPEDLRAVQEGLKTQLRQPLDVFVPDGARITVQPNGTLRWQKDAQRGELVCPFGAVGEWLNLLARGSADAPIAVEVVRIRAQRIQDITDAEMRADQGASGDSDAERVRESFVQRWDESNARRGATWERNPWVWVAEFQHVD